METLTLPRLVGSREAVRDLLAEQSISEDLSDDGLVVLCRDLASGSSSFADELVFEVLQRRRAPELVIVGAPIRFGQRVEESASRRGVEHQVSIKMGAALRS